jgi:restriction system protein
LIRGGRDGEREATALRDGTVIAGWDKLGDLTGCDTKDDIRQELALVYPGQGKATIANWTGQLWRLTKEIQEGDWVVMPLKTQQRIAIGRVAGPYAYHGEAPPGFRQVRPVTWIRTDISRAAIQQDLLDSMGSLLTVCQLKRFGAADRVAALVAHGTDPGPGLDERPHHGLNSPHDVAEKAAHQEAGKPFRLTIRELLAGWGATRRTPAVVDQIQAFLGEQGLTTRPPFTDGWLDNVIEIVPVGEEPPETGALNLARAASDADDVSEFPALALRVGVLRPSNQGVERVLPDDDIQIAQSKMVARNFSQLAVIDEDGVLHGAVSWESIGMAAIARPVTKVAEALSPARAVDYNEDLLEQIEEIYRRGYVFVRGPDRTVSGIITAADLTTQFGDLARPFVLIEEAERRLRRRTDEVFTSSEIAAVARRKTVTSAADLTIGNYSYLLRDRNDWLRFKWPLNYAFFMEQLERVRVIRNELMHFSPDPLTSDQLACLEGFVRMLRTVDRRE